jgi:predicted nucleic acid-binding protein
MTRYLLDTNAIGDFLNHRYDVPARVQAARTRGFVIGTCEPVVAELYFGVENSATRDENLARLKRGIRRIKCWPLPPSIRGIWALGSGFETNGTRDRPD